MRLKPEGLWSTMSGGECLWYWSLFTNVVLAKHHILLIAGDAATPIPRRAFAIPEEAQRFFDASVTLWKANAAEWPPAPRVGVESR